MLKVAILSKCDIKLWISQIIMPKTQLIALACKMINFFRCTNANNCNSNHIQVNLSLSIIFNYGYATVFIDGFSVLVNCCHANNVTFTSFFGTATFT